MFGTNHWCHREAAEGSSICAHHRGLLARRVVRQHALFATAIAIRTGVETLVQLEPRPTWQEAIHHVLQIPPTSAGEMDIAHSIALRYYMRHDVRLTDTPAWRIHAPLWRFRMLWEWVRDGADGQAPNVDVPPPPPPQVPQPLARLADDAQNVHTTAVSNQTNRGMEMLRETMVPKEQQTEKSMMAAWLLLLPMVGWVSLLKVAQDVNVWFNTKTCRAPNDMLYRSLLRGLVARINQMEGDDLKSELYKRLWEECREATGLCCEGHLTRLCNVLVGFDEAFQPPVSLGDMVQHKMSAISLLPIDEEEKRRLATAWFEEVAMPVAERTAWLEAF